MIFHASQKNTSKQLKKKKEKRQNMLVLSVSLLQLLPGFTSVNLDKAQARNMSACAGSMNVSLQEKKEKPPGPLPGSLRQWKL